MISRSKDTTAWRVSTIFLCFSICFLLISSSSQNPLGLPWIAWLHFNLWIILFFSSHKTVVYFYYDLSSSGLLPLLLFLSSYLCVAFSFCFSSSSSSQLMTTNTQMVSLSLSLCHPPRLSVFQSCHTAWYQNPHRPFISCLVLAVVTSPLGFCVVCRC